MKEANNLYFGSKGRILYVVFMTFVMMACNNNAPDIPSGDRSMLNKASKNVVSVMGKTRSAADKAIRNAGFRKLEDDDSGYVYARRKMKAPQFITDDEDADCYVYNLSEGMEDLDDEEVVNAIIESKKTAIIFMAYYEEGKLANINGKLIVGAEIDNVNKVYLDCSDNLHKNITALGSWQGSIAESYDESSVEYTNYDKFYDTVYPMNSVFTTEAAACALNMLGTKSFGYGLTWDKPNEEKARFQINNDGYLTAIAEGGFSITYMEYNY